jgi:hypothetical protein
MQIFLLTYFGTVHSLTGESAQCTHCDWRNGPDNRYNPAAREGLNSSDALSSHCDPSCGAIRENFDVQK